MKRRPDARCEQAGPQEPAKLFIWFLCLLAGARTFLFCAAFPFFNNVDEQAHLDLVMKYARGDVPRDLGHYSSESANSIALYGTPEYFMAPGQFATNDFPPPNWTLPARQREQAVNTSSAWWLSNENHESGEPPLYYVIAGLWLNLGRVVGITGAGLLYWVRFLNVFVAGTLVWIGFLAAKLVFPDRQFIHFSVPILLAVWPQTTFYSIQSDLLSPLCFGIAFIGMIEFLRAEPPTVPLGIWIGLALAATCLVKATSIALLLVPGIALIFKVQRFSEKIAFRSVFVPLAALIISAVLPIAAWFVWNYHTFGDLTATSSKIEFLGWTRKPVGNWWPHPIFTLNGVKEFWPELMASFWRGEFIWYGKRLASQTSDAFYWISSTLAIGLAVISLFPRSTKLADFQRGALWLAFSSFAVLVLSVVLLSMAFDFGLCVYPSREHPYFTSGRLLSAAAVPFFLLYSEALDCVMGRIPRQWPRAILFAGIVLFIVVSQSVVNWPALSSDYNWFHLHQGVNQGF
ncbi:MAG: hypothetical protein C5B58_14505 [Acidobacteria bacterium]|nr:MAG: hypothetical protein C5B58_14505 [Acidobacteriota bacterium]